MKRFYVVFKDGRVFVVMGKNFQLSSITPIIELIAKSVQCYSFWDEMGIMVGQFYYDDVLCITNEKPEGHV